MRQFLRAYYDRLLLGLMLVAVGASWGWFWLRRADVDRIRALPVHARLSDSEYNSVAVPANREEIRSWAEPVAQSAGSGWLYELFTPPVVFYHPQTASFTVLPPLEAKKTSEVFDLELVGVKQELYRVQLAGYFGEPGNYKVMFTSADLPDPLVARLGDPLANLGVTLKDFSVKRVVQVETDDPPVDEVAAFAELFDDKEGAFVMLDSRKPKFSDIHLAIVRAPSLTGALREVREGEAFSESGYTYRIERIQSEPAELSVSRYQTDASFKETATLRVPHAEPSPVAVQPVDSHRFSSRPATGLATNAK